MNRFILIVIASFILSGCNGQSDETIMKNTSSKVLESIKSKNTKKFKGLIGVELDVIGKDDEFLQTDLDELGLYYERYTKNTTPPITLTDEYDQLGHRRVIIVFYKGTDTANNISEVNLELFFGPPNFVPLTKISDYKIVVKNLKEKPITAPPNIN